MIKTNVLVLVAQKNKENRKAVKIYNSLDEHWFNKFLVTVDSQGNWYYHNELPENSKFIDLKGKKVFIKKDSVGAYLNEQSWLGKKKYLDAAIIVDSHLSGQSYSSLTGLLHTLQVSVVGPTVKVSSLLSKKMYFWPFLEYQGYTLPDYFSFLVSDFVGNKQSIIAEVNTKIGFPCKLFTGDESFEYIKNQASLKKLLKDQEGHLHDITAQKLIKQGYYINISVLQSHGQLHYSNIIKRKFNYSSDILGAVELVENENLKEELQELSGKLFRYLNLSVYTNFEYIYTHHDSLYWNNLYFLSSLNNEYLWGKSYQYADLLTRSIKESLLTYRTDVVG